MKNSILILTFILFSINLLGQGNSGLGFNYQAVVRGADGSVLPGQSIELRFTLMPGQNDTQASWVETHTVTTDAYGTVGVTVGKGVKAGGEAAKFEDVNFAGGYYWMGVEVKDGAVYRELQPLTALQSVPYAEIAHNAVTIDAINALIEDAVKTAMEDANAATSAAIEAAILMASAPVGSIMPFAGDTIKIPQGWLLCSGRAVKISEYKDLYDVIGTAWGRGSDNDKFNLPDMRGMFLRGVSYNSGNDEDAEEREPLGTGKKNEVGSYQEDAIRNITGKIGMHTHTDSPAGLFELQIWGNYSIGSGNYLPYNHFGLFFDASKADGVLVGSDNRPKNVYVNYIIKY